MAAVAERMAEELEQLLPERREDIRRGLASARQELMALHDELSAMLAPARGEVFYVFHPAFGWFAGRYGLKERSVERHGKTPGAREFDALVNEIRDAGVRVLFTQPGYPAAEVEALARHLGLRARELDLTGPDYPAAMRRLAEEILGSLDRNA